MRLPWVAYNDINDLTGNLNCVGVESFESPAFDVWPPVYRVNRDGDVVYGSYNVLVTNLFRPPVAADIDDCVGGSEPGLIDDDGLTLWLIFTLSATVMFVDGLM